MKILQISDLHIDESFDWDSNLEMIKKMIFYINKQIKLNEDIYIVCCGDISNEGKGNEYFGKAKRYFDFIKSKISKKDIELIFVPGNHDICDGEFTKFQDFLSIYNNRIDFLNNNVILYDTPNLAFLLVNSCHKKDYRYGSIDIESFEELLKEVNKPAIVIMHHTLLSAYNDDVSAVRDAYKFIELLEKSKKIIGVLHGHIHGYSNILVGNQCRFVGVGSIFKHIHNCNNQFNFVDIKLKRIEKITNFRFNKDLRDFTEIVLYENLEKNYIKDNKVSIAYEKVIESVTYWGGINSLFINVKTSLDDYKEDMNNNFTQDIKTAKLWLEQEVPKSLYYNHGSYMFTSEKKGIDFIVEELTRNSTSNRAIIPLISFNDVLKKQFDNLPGLVSVQFGFKTESKDELYCSMNLRSLEVKHFLRINLSELYILILKISNEIRSINKLDISVYAFKAQYKENFSCFKQAEIDTLSPGAISKIVYSKNVDEMIRLLKDKFEMEETVINLDGLNLLYNIINESDSDIFGFEVSASLKKIIDDLGRLRDEYKKSSNYVTITPIENRIHSKQQKYISQLEALKKP